MDRGPSFEALLLFPARAAADWVPGPGPAALKWWNSSQPELGSGAHRAEAFLEVGTMSSSKSRVTCPGSGHADCYAELISITKLVMCDVSLRHSRTQRNWIEIYQYLSYNQNQTIHCQLYMFIQMRWHFTETKVANQFKQSCFYAQLNIRYLQ